MKNISKINGISIGGNVLPEVNVGNLLNAENGLDRDASTVILGGKIIQDTIINNPDGHQFTISGAKFIGDGSGLTGVSGGGGVPQTSSPNRTYVTTPNGQQSYIPYSNTVAESNAMVQYNTDGNVFVSNPTDNSHATPKSYVDTAVEHAVAGGYLVNRLDSIFVVGDGNITPSVIGDLDVPLEQGERIWWVVYELLIGCVGTIHNTNVQIVFPSNPAPGLAISGNASIQGDANSYPVSFDTPIHFSIDNNPKLVTIALRVEGFPEGGNWNNLQIAAAGVQASDPPLQVYEGSRVTSKMYYGVA